MTDTLDSSTPLRSAQNDSAKAVFSSMPTPVSPPRERYREGVPTKTETAPVTVLGFTPSCAIPYTLYSRVKQIYRMGGTKWLEADDPNENHGSQRKRRPACRVSHRSASWRLLRSRSSERSGSPRKKTSSKTAIIGYEEGADRSLPPSLFPVNALHPILQISARHSMKLDYSSTTPSTSISSAATASDSVSVSSSGGAGGGIATKQ